jgi:hypothetical protein
MLFSRFLAILALGGLCVAQAASQPSGAASSNPASNAQASTPNNAGAQTKSPHQNSQKGANPDAERERSGADPLLDLPPLPNNPATLVGGTVAKLDRIRDRFVLRPFGGGDMNIAFDMRTKIYRNGGPGTVHDLKPGSRVYVDTMLNGDQVFARSIRVQTGAGHGEARGQVLAYDRKHNVLTLREQVSPQPIKLRISPQTAVQVNGKPASIAELQPGSLVVIQFESGNDKRDIAREIRVLASPGASFTFAGTVTFLDLRARRMAMDNRTDGENYEILLGSIPASMMRNLRVGSDATVTAVFDGQNYQAHEIEVMSPAAKNDQNP